MNVTNTNKIIENQKNINNIYSVLIHFTGALFAFVLFTSNGLIGISGLIALLLALFIKKNDFLIYNAKQVFNFQITMALILIFKEILWQIIFALSFMMYSFPNNKLYQFFNQLDSIIGQKLQLSLYATPVLFFIIVCSIFGIVKSGQGKEFKYPLTFKFLK